MARAIYTLVGPDGTEFDLEGPANATPEMIKAEAAKAFGQFSAPRERPPVDPASENLDPRDVQSRRRPAPATTLLGKLREVAMIGPGGGVARGIQDVGEGAVQGAAHLGGMTGLVEPETVGDVDRYVQQSNREYLWNTGRKEGDLDVARVGGRVLGSVAVTPARLLRGATMGQRAAGAAVAGGIAGAVEPVTGDENPGNSYAWEKGKQIGVGVAAGAIGSPIIEGLVGVATPVINRVVQFVRNAAGRIRAPAQVDNLIAQELEQVGIQWRTLPEQVRQALREDVRQATEVGQITDPAALRRLTDIRASGATPTRGSVTLNPVEVTAEKNAAKMGAASSDPALQELALLENRNNAALIGRINQFGQTTEDAASGFKVGKALGEEWQRVTAKVNSLYDRARSLNGGEIPLNTKGRATDVIMDLENTGKLKALDGVGADILNTINQGVPITIGRAEGMKTSLAAEIRKAQKANDGNAEMALKRVYSVLEEAEPAIPLGADVMAAFRAARDANRARMGLLERSPVLREVYSESFNPEQFFKKHVLSPAVQATDLQELRKLTTARPEVLDSIRNEVVSHLKRRALNQASDEVGTFSQSAYNKALQAIGDRKLAVFFGPEEIAQMKQLGRAASYLQVQPKGSAVNNSQTGAAIFQQLERVLTGVPVVGSAIRSYGKRAEEMALREAARNALRRPLPSQGAVSDPVRNALIQSSGPASIAIGMGLSQ